MAEEAARRGGKCQDASCDVEWRPGTSPRERNPVHWHHGRQDDRRASPVSKMVARAKTTDRELKAPNIRYDTGLRWRLVIELMAKCGMRVSEVCNLTIRDLHQDDDWKIEIKDAKTGDRVIYLPPELEPLMTIWLARRTAGFPRSKYLFPTASGGRLTRGNVADMIDRSRSEGRCVHDRQGS